MQVIDCVFPEFGMEECNMIDPDFYAHWNNDELSYDVKRYDFTSEVLKLIQELYPSVDCLENIHKFVPSNCIVDICDHVQDSFAQKKYMIMFDQFAKEYVEPKLNNKRYLIKRQPTLNCVIPNQQYHARRLPFHQGIFYKNGRGMATMWMPLTVATKTNSMYIANLEDSRKLTKEVINEKLDQDEFERRCLTISQPVEKSPGQVHLFTQEQIHGNVNNTTGYTRCAIDWHVLIEGEEYGGREPGGFFRLPGDYEQDSQTKYNNKTFIAYVGNNSRYDKEIPIHFQRKIINDYCKSKEIKHNGFIFENEHLDWLPILEHYITEKIDGIVMLSIHSLPNDTSRSKHLLNLAVENSVQLHFANELCSLTTQKDLEKISTYMSFAPKQKGKFPWTV